MLRAKKLSMRYNDKLALKNLDFSVAPGEIFCLLGQNGAGKTTTINIFLGLLEPTSGEALIDNHPVTKKSNRNSIAYIPEIVQLYGNLSGVENLDFFSRIAGFNYSEKELFKYLEKANLQEEAFKKKLSTYSKGMRQKVGIAIALAKNASYILMDEPTSGLDPKASLEFAKTCKELSTNGVGILMATHDIFNAVNICARIGIMKEGTLVHIAETENISAQQLQELYVKTI
ncbi:ABC-2 type transport system ATP-binding protein [Tenacibaculum skagerrakense]|uniref:ABC-2 type transport system ATP-binding protein n=1 Tax=Tenacibaculum skagerrakense TaxID=186571 RepID=A0A4R2NMS3_9FLAO|nr:ABC transporter ATP-binding protein [Tenacibaculum skagerrakense]TCP22979.1 ABC-2 type transport system ATP-binding protein [Tenacibaculum skagerrakense]